SSTAHQGPSRSPDGERVATFQYPAIMTGTIRRTLPSSGPARAIGTSLTAAAARSPYAIGERAATFPFPAITTATARRTSRSIVRPRAIGTRSGVLTAEFRSWVPAQPAMFQYLPL